MDCAVCGRPARRDPLCNRHKRELSTSDDLTPEQVRGKRRAGGAVIAWLVDMFGFVHPVVDGAVVGRSPERADLAVLHGSVSSAHAAIRLEDGQLVVEDLESTNGTRVGASAIAKPAVIEDDPALVRFGSVSFYMTREPAADLRSGAGTGHTVKGRDQAGRFPLHLASGDWSLSLGADGAVLTGPDQSATLSAMEGRLLKALLERAAEETYTPSAVLVASVGFGSRSADGDNVRELVARVRRKLAKVGLKGLIESKPRTGYRLAPTMLRQR